MKIEETLPRVDEPGRFFIALNLMVTMVFLMAIIAVGVVFYGGWQFVAR